MISNIDTHVVPKSAQQNGEALNACLNEMKAVCARHGVAVGLIAIGIPVEVGGEARVESATTNCGHPSLQFELLRALGDRIKEHAELLASQARKAQA